MSDDTQADQDPTENIEIFSTDDEKIRSIGELLTNDSSRTILQLLFKEEMTATQLAQKTGTSLQLVKYHLNKMQDVGVVRISKIEKNIKAQDMKYYKATKFAIVILPSKISDKAKESKMLLRSIKTIYRFAGIGVAAVASWFATRTLQGTKQASLTMFDPDAQLTPVEPGLEPIEHMAEPNVEVPSERSEYSVSEQTTEQESTWQSSESQEPTHSGVESLDKSVYPVPFEEETGDMTLEETLDLAQRKIEDDVPTAVTGSGTPLSIPDISMLDILLQFLVPIIVVSIGLIIELYLRSRRRKIEKRSAIN